MPPLGSPAKVGFVNNPGRPWLPILSVPFGAAGGLACRVASTIVPDPWPSLLTTSATWGLLVCLLLLAANRITRGAARSSRTTAQAAGIPSSTGIRAHAVWASSGAGCMLLVLLTSGAWISVLTVPAALVAGAVVGLVTARIAAGEVVWFGAIAGLLMGEGIYGIALVPGSWRVGPFDVAVQYLAEFLAGTLLCLVAGRRWLASLGIGGTMAAVIGAACLVYDSVRHLA